MYRALCYAPLGSFLSSKELMFHWKRNISTPQKERVKRAWDCQGTGAKWHWMWIQFWISQPWFYNPRMPLNSHLIGVVLFNCLASLWWKRRGRLEATSKPHPNSSVAGRKPWVMTETDVKLEYIKAVRVERRGSKKARHLHWTMKSLPIEIGKQLMLLRTLNSFKIRYSESFLFLYFCMLPAIQNVLHRPFLFQKVFVVWLPSIKLV